MGNNDTELIKKLKENSIVAVVTLPPPDMLCHLSMASSKFYKKERVLEIKIFGTRPL